MRTKKPLFQSHQSKKDLKSAVLLKDFKYPLYICILTGFRALLYAKIPELIHQMKSIIIRWVRTMIGMMSCLPVLISAQTNVSGADSLSSHFIHRLGVELRLGYIIPTHDFLRGNNEMMKPIRQSFSAHLQYAFQSQPNTLTDRIYGSAYQGIGLAGYAFGEREQLGNPVALYLFQGARIARLAPRISLNYEWDFGLSVGWKPYDPDTNPFNRIIGSKANAYLNTNFYLNWALSSQIDLATGIALTHFSNGNTDFPNAGLNTVGLKIGLVYNFNRADNSQPRPMFRPQIQPFPRHISYDLVLFGSWRRKGVAVGDEQIASPDTYTVLGFNFAPMYNIGYKFRAGISADVVYDGSANIYIPPYIVGTTPQFVQPSFDEQLALGLSARLEYVMPYFTVGLGLGANVLHGGNDLKGCYQVLALKIATSHSSFIHIGYNLQNFHTPNYLMLGFGFRFHNLYPSLHK